MDRKIAPVAKYNCVTVFALRIIADGTCRVLGRHGEVWFRNVLGLDTVQECWKKGNV